MVGPFEWYGVRHVVFGSGNLARLSELAQGLGRCALVVTNADRRHRQGLHERLDRLLGEANIRPVRLWLQGEPQVAQVDAGAALARESGCDMVVAIGGGSAIDTGKAVGALITNGGSALDYMEVIGAGRPLTRAAAPVIAIPTTAGTGAEVTRNAVIGSPEHQRKASLRSPLLLPRLVIVDPELHQPVRGSVVAASGMDALTQLIESYTSARANPMTDALALAGLNRAARSLPQVCARPDDLAAREDMALAALFSGITLAGAGLGAVHGFAGPLGGLLDAPHGTICAALLAPVLSANASALDQSADADRRRRLADIGRILTSTPQMEDAEAIDAGIQRCAALRHQLRIPGLAELGLKEDMIGDVVRQSRKSSSMRYNPAELDDETLAGILRAAM